MPGSGPQGTWPGTNVILIHRDHPVLFSHTYCGREDRYTWETQSSHLLFPMKAAHQNLLRCILCLIGGAIFIGCPLAYSAWRWSLRPVMTPEVYTAGNDAWTVEWIEARWPNRVVDPRTLPEAEAGSLKTAWPRAEYEARLMYLFYGWLGSAGTFAVLVLLVLIFKRPARPRAPA